MTLKSYSVFPLPAWVIKFDFVSLGCILLELIKTHDAAKEYETRANHVSILTKLRFSYIYNSVIFYSIDANVAVEVPTYQGRLHTKFEENHVSHFRHMSEQTSMFLFFSFFFFLFFVFSKMVS